MNGVLAQLYAALTKQNEPTGILASRNPMYTYGGIPTRQPYQSESDFFRSSGVPGYAAEDNAVVMNPLANLMPDQKRAVLMNEAARVWMRQNNLTPNFGLTPQQSQSLGATAYKDAPEQDRAATTVARLLSGDPSGGDPTPEQSAFVKRLRYGMGLLGK